MQANACQWCADRYGEHYYEKSPADAPRVQMKEYTDSIAAVPGAYWPLEARSAHRERVRQDKLDCNVGFRVARTQ
jgi:hypothetical protein